MSEPESEAVLRQVERILTSGGFVNADRLCRFLRFTVEARLKGEQGQIKEYLIGREVFDRNDEYDPRLDPIVRVEARRLRVRLQEYYGGAGRADPIRIEFPKGGYVPTIELASEAGMEPKVRRHPARYTVGAVLLVVMALSIFRLFPFRKSKMIAVVPARWIWADTRGLNVLDEPFAEAIAAELANRRAARIIAWPSIVSYRTAGKQSRQLAAELGAAKVLIVAVRGEGATPRVTVFFVDAASGQKMWVKDYFSEAPPTLEAQRDLARRVSDEFQANERK
jgi:serine/threonine-protein kinase